MDEKGRCMSAGSYDDAPSYARDGCSCGSSGFKSNLGKWY